jgi:pleiotropic regulator 1
VLRDKGHSSAAVSRRLGSKWPRPAWHAPWRLYRVVSGHLGWVRSVAFDPGNEWFATGSSDRTIKLWDLASGTLKITLTGHIEQVNRALRMSGTQATGTQNRNTVPHTVY